MKPDRRVQFVRLNLVLMISAYWKIFRILIPDLDGVWTSLHLVASKSEIINFKVSACSDENINFILLSVGRFLLHGYGSIAGMVSSALCSLWCY